MSLSGFYVCGIYFLKFVLCYDFISHSKNYVVYNFLIYNFVYF